MVQVIAASSDYMQITKAFIPSMILISETRCTVFGKPGFHENPAKAIAVDDLYHGISIAR